jgi:O-antigen polymerase
VALFFLIISIDKLLGKPNVNFTFLSYGIITLSTVESCYCLSQFLGFFSSQSKLFAVTGSWVNPNVVAQFLAITIPFFLYLLQFQFKKIMLSCLGIVLIALVLLKCRSAYIGSVVSVIVYYGLKYDFKSWLINPKNKKSVRTLFVIFLILVIPLASNLYTSKKASADGRIFIWKLSAMMAIEKPITGYGYGLFEKEYNLFQAAYIGQGKATLEEQTTAGPTLMPYNEILQNAVNGGAIGLLLFLVFFSSLLISNQPKRAEDLNIIAPSVGITNKNNLAPLAYAGIVGFLVMSLVNFAIQVVPVMAVLILYAAIVCRHLNPICLTYKSSFLLSKWLNFTRKSFVCLCCCYLLYAVLNIAYADSLNKKASILKSNGQFKEALKLMISIENWQKEEPNYWSNYANIHFLNKDFLAAQKCIGCAKKLSSTPNLYLGSGICYYNQKLYAQAIKQYTRLVLLHPSKFNYRFRLMTAYFKNKDTTNALIVAKGILDLKPKIPSEKVTKYKKIVYKLSLALDKNFKTKEKLKKQFLQTKNQRQLHF